MVRPIHDYIKQKKTGLQLHFEKCVGPAVKGGLFPYQRRCAMDVDERSHDVAEAEGIGRCIDVEGLAVRRVYAGQGAVEGIGLLPLIGVKRRLVFVDLANQPA